MNEWASPILKQLNWLSDEFRCIQNCQFIFFTLVIQAILVLFCLYVVEDMAQDITIP